MNTINLTPDEFAARFAPVAAATPDNYFIRNRETGKLELHFDKATYDELTDAQKQSIRSNFLWGRRTGCWISRAKEPNLWHAERTAKDLGLADAGTTGERLSFAEQQQRKAERAERRADRFEDRAIDAEQNAKRLQKPIEDRRGDIAFFTQPNIDSSAGRAFARRREKMFAAFDRGMEEYRKSEHYRERAEIARRTAGRAELKDRGFIDRRIRECEANVRKLRRSIEEYETVTMPKAIEGTLRRYTGEPVSVEDVQAQMDHWLDRLEAELDKLGYYQDAMDALGGVQYSQENIRPGYEVRVKTFGVIRVMSAGPKNFTGTTQHGITLTYSYAEIIELVSSEPEAPKTHPFKVGESFTLRNGVTHTIVKVSAKTVTLKPSEGDPYRVTPKYRPIPAAVEGGASAPTSDGKIGDLPSVAATRSGAADKWRWVMHVGGSHWSAEFIYRD